MSQITANAALPAIIVGESDYDTLSALAAAAAPRMPEVAETLLNELDRATVVDSDAVPPGIVRIGSRVTYRTDAVERQVTLVMPSEADISAGRVSVLTPIGAALLGLSTGQTIEWPARDGRLHHLQVLAVERPAASRR
ncbi:MAG: nucleoside diphosphate kinase regulator [Bacteroidota bacterium]|nr:nucleoside diphosphate kinase regulator [Kiloniellaceae bacterium]